jgi:hypothetical protein
MSQPLKRQHIRKPPWWAHVLIAAILYIGLTYFVPTLHSEDPRIATFLDILPNLAPIGAIGFLLLAAKALYDDVPGKETPPQDEEKNSEQ